MNAYIKHISHYLPEKVLTNEQLIREFPAWSVQKVTEKIGISQRHICDDNETAADLAIKASKKLFLESCINPNSIDFILYCTQSPDYFLPSTACIIQSKLGIPTTSGALDFNLGCSGYVYGLSLAKGLIVSGIAKNILFITSETYTKYIHEKDKVNRSIFGDGSAATIISTEGIAEIGDFVLGTDGKGAENLIVKTGCAKFPKKEGKTNYEDEGTFFSPDYLYMNGSEVFNFTLGAVPSLIQSILTKCNLQKDDVDYFLFHQANKYMLNTLRKVCKINEENFYIDMEDTGNTVSSTIPIALSRLIKSQNFNSKSSNIIIAGFGVGYSWGSCLLKFK